MINNYKKFTGVILLVFCIHLTGFSQNISLNLKNITVKSAMETLMRKYGYSFVYESGDVNFRLNVSENAILQVSFIGYHNQEIAVGTRMNLKITLRENVQALDEVVVVGYSTQKKAHLSGAVSTISSKALENRPVAWCEYHICPNRI